MRKSFSLTSIDFIIFGIAIALYILNECASNNYAPVTYKGWNHTLFGVYFEKSIQMRILRALVIFLGALICTICIRKLKALNGGTFRFQLKSAMFLMLLASILLLLNTREYTYPEVPGSGLYGRPFPAVILVYLGNQVIDRFISYSDTLRDAVLCIYMLGISTILFEIVTRRK